MSSIEKLSIRGIRSFSPSHDETIEFYYPLTMIVGANGCGKTTIIECLKYSCTGVFPPGSSHGKGFVHDPRMNDTPEVKGCIRLRFRNRGGQQMVVQRSVQLTQNKTTATFKALDGVIRTMDENKKKVSIGHKCGELDRHIPDLLGVSKAILENVIFCHQEDSNWPLGEPTLLKKKFDDIFESARYTKALDAIGKIKKVKNAYVKELKSQLQVCQVHRKLAGDLQDKIVANDKKLEQLVKEMKQLSEKNNSYQQCVLDWEEKLEEERQRQQKIQVLTNQIQEKEATVHRMYESMQTVMNDSDEELENLLENHEAMSLQAEVQTLQDKKNRMEKELGALREAMTKHSIMKGKLEANLESQEEVKQKISQLMQTLGIRYGITVNASIHTLEAQEHKDEVIQFTKVFHNRKGTKEKELAKLKEEQQLKEDHYAKEITELHSKKHHSQEQMKEKSRRLGELSSEQEDVNDKLKKLTAGKSHHRDKSEAQRRVDEAQERLEKHQERYHPLELKKELQEWNKKISDFHFETEQLDEKLKHLRLNARDHLALASKRKEALRKKQDLDDLILEQNTTQSGSCARTLLQRELSIPTLTQDMADLVSLQRVRKLELATLTKDWRRVENTHAIHESKVRDLQQDLAQLEQRKLSLDSKDIRELTQHLENFCPEESLETADVACQKLEERFYQLKEELTEKSMRHKFLRMCKDKGQRNRDCPICSRAMNSQELEIFSRSIDEKTTEHKLREKTRRATEKKEVAEHAWKSVSGLLSSWREWTRVCLSLETTRNQLDEACQGQKEAQSETQSKKLLVESAERSLRQLDQVVHQLEDVVQMRVNEVVHLVQQLREESRRLGMLIDSSNDSNDPLDLTNMHVYLGTTNNNNMDQDNHSSSDALSQAENEKDKIQSELNIANRELQKKQSELTSCQELGQRLQQDVFGAKHEFEKWEADAREVDLMKQKRDGCREEEIRVKQLLEELQLLEAPLDRELQLKNKERHHYRLSVQEELSTVEEALLSMNDGGRQLAHFTHQYSMGEAQGYAQDLDELVIEMSELMHEQRQLSHELQILEPELKDQERQLHQQQSLKVRIRENLNYRVQRREYQALQEQLSNSNHTSSTSDTASTLDQIQNEIKLARAKVAGLRDERSECRGKKHQIEEHSAEHRAELKSEDLRNIDEAHRQKLIEFETTKLAVTDLDKYYRALDAALVEYHARKIREINTIIRELWQITYRGQDIDTIEIVSGPDGPASASSSSSASVKGRGTKTYNYRVLMRKGNVKLDMRGRCSAGQKVLASLVIRLALAETFCLNCGILALDEPTTNLDHANKIGFAQALSDIIISRSSQSNFQLVCITHDESFVKVLGNAQLLGASNPGYYWRISREEVTPNKFCSRIDRQNWGDE